MGKPKPTRQTKTNCGRRLVMGRGRQSGRSAPKASHTRSVCSTDRHRVPIVTVTTHGDPSTVEVQVAVGGLDRLRRERDPGQTWVRHRRCPSSGSHGDRAELRGVYHRLLRR
eukprot:scaffold100381_cov66-Phaeocystis_antarctica.AAC.5